MFAYLWSGKSLAVGMLMFASLTMAGGAEDRRLETSSVAPADAGSIQTNAPAPAPERKRLGRPSTSAAIQEILRMLEAGVSKEVVKAYVESATIASKPTAADMIALKQRGVPDEITVALLKRSAQLSPPVRPENSQPMPNFAALPRYATNAANPAYLDPESYEYFQYHYLYPRTLASAYDRLGLYPWAGPWAYYPGYYAHGSYFPPHGNFGFPMGSLR